jgi:2-polyprenyl-3-methyl-5-hydroxy-6-metoxy-1,4-benzoquinol methylase
MKPAAVQITETGGERSPRNYGGIYERYAETRPHHPAPHSAADLLRGRGPTFQKRFAPLLPKARDARILDVGCGYGEFLYFLQRAGYSDTCGIDLDSAHVKIASDLGVGQVHRADAREFLRSSPGYDFISAIDVLEHFPKHEVIDLVECARHALKPGGRFLCQVPNVAAFFAPLFYMDFTHQTPFTASSLKQVLELAGLVKVRVFPMGPVVHGLGSAVRCLLWKSVTTMLGAIQTIEGGPRDELSSIFTAAIGAIAERE